MNANTAHIGEQIVDQRALADAGRLRLQDEAASEGIADHPQGSRLPILAERRGQERWIRPLRRRALVAAELQRGEERVEGVGASFLHRCVGTRYGASGDARPAPGHVAISSNDRRRYLLHEPARALAALSRARR
jgi:hypothetical protein